MWSVTDWRTDELFLSLSNHEKGLYRELIDECWINGSISSSPELLCSTLREPLEVVSSIWQKISYKFIPAGRGRVTSKRLEKDRLRLEVIREKRIAAGQLGGLAKAKQTPSKQGSKTLAKPSQTQTADTDSRQQTEQEGIPATEKRAGKPDVAAELFKAAYHVSIGNPYEWLSGDFTGIMKLRKRLKLETRDTPDQWEPAIANYFASPFDTYSLRHFVSKFDTFKNSALDRFKVPINHANGGNGNGSKLSREQQKSDNTEAAARRVLFESTDTPGGAIPRRIE